MFRCVDANRQIRNIALSGFMGCGKTAVGRIVAKVAGFEFLDTDQFIEEHVGKSIPRIFEEHGEETFRRYEREVVMRLAERENTVIATGGGLLVDAENMDTMKQYAMVFCLWASPESIWRRVKGQSHRPLLNTDNPKQRIIDLLEERKPAYRPLRHAHQHRVPLRKGRRQADPQPVSPGDPPGDMKAAIRQHALELGFDDCRFTTADPPDAARDNS